MDTFLDDDSDIDLDELDDYESDIDLDEYEASEEAKEATWWDLAKDVVIQPALGAASAFTWPADVLKMGMVGEALTDLDELETAFEKAGKPFDRNQYLKAVADQSQFIPTQSLLEDVISAKTGISLEPKTKIGKAINKFFTLTTMLRKGGLGKAALGGAVGAGTSEGLKAAGVNETAAEFLGDIAGASTASLKKGPKQFSPDVEQLKQVADKHGLPFPEYMTKESSQLVGPKISDQMRLAAEKELGMSTEKAISEIIEGKIPVSKLKNKGQDLEVLYSDAYDHVKDLVKDKKNPVKVDQILSDIQSEVKRIRSLAPSPSDAERTAIAILEKEAKRLKDNPADAAQMIQQIKNYNSNVKSIYRKPEFTGKEQEITSAYAFLNNSIRNTIESEVGTDVRKAMAAADSLFSQTAKLNKAEGLISKAFVNGEYNPKKLNAVLSSKEGKTLVRDLGVDAVNEIREIAKYGEKAVNATSQLARTERYLGNIAEWGPIAGFVLHSFPKAGGLLLAAKPLANRVRGYLLMNPATRTAYRDVVKNAANGSFKSMAADFGKIESEISKDFGSVEEFFKSLQDEELEID